MAVINVLPVHLVNKIAAGEVIERPASVVKELVENAVDAGANRIDVTIEDGGRKLIAVSDDGCGMTRDDLALAFVPHATSKLADDEDLFRIHTMGFRGEALASIASISHAHIRSRRRDSDDSAGYELAASGDRIEQVKPCSHRGGTTVTIRDLFFNTPARRKFLRTTNTELGHVTEQLTRLALPHPQIAFTLTHNGRQIQNLPASNSTAQRARDLLGSELADTLIPLIGRTGPVGVAGLIGPPATARSSSKWQYVFLNGRYVRDRLLAHALREAYRGRVDPSRYPVVLIFLEVDSADVDVNVHPTKIEVRFRESQAVHGALLASLKETLNRASLTPEASLDRATDDSDEGSSDQRDPSGQAQRESLRQALADFFKSAPTQSRLDFPRQASEKPAASPDQGPTTTRPRTQTDTEEPADELYTGPMVRTPWGAKRPAQVPQPPEKPTETAPPPAEQAEAEAAQPVRPAPTPAPGVGPILQVHDSYLICQSAAGLMIIDQHAMHERILYNRFRKRLAEGALASQRLLLPETLKVTAAEMALLETHEELLGQLGIAIEAFGPRTAAIQQFPAVLLSRQVQPGDFIRQLLDTLADDESADAERLLESVLAVMACKAAIKANHPLTQEEMADLVARGRDQSKSSACPHGRPTTIHLSLKDLEKQFHRT